MNRVSFGILDMLIRSDGATTNLCRSKLKVVPVGLETLTDKRYQIGFIANIPLLYLLTLMTTEYGTGYLQHEQNRIIKRYLRYWVC